MKIGFDAKRATSNFTGLGNYSRTLIKDLQLFYPENEYLLFTPVLKQTQRYLHLSDHNLSRFILPGNWLSRRFNAFWRTFLIGHMAAKQGVDVFHGLSGELPLFLPASIRVILTVHDLIFIRFPAYYKLFDRIIYRIKLVYACKRADQIIAISEQTKNDLVNYLHISPEKITVVYQACDSVFRNLLEPFQKQRICDKYNLPPNYLLTVGTLEERKNTLNLLKAFQLLPKTNQLVLVGRKTAYTKILEQYISEFNLNARVLILSDVSFDDLPAVYQSALLFIYPSVFEGFGIPIEEALFSQVPVISSTGSCFAEAGGPDSIYIDHTDYENLADEIEKLICNNEKRGEMIRNGRIFAEKFMPANLSAELIAVYT